MIRNSPALASGLDARFSVRPSHTLPGNVNIDLFFGLAPKTLWMLVSVGAHARPLPDLLRFRNKFGSPGNGDPELRFDV